ncbi:MAG: hypothetical protein LQ340_005879 [Diploschistes diacapsis]|nr:MAG: hypothetical protein LQ340_005879 [Diploschistes diacapsis]
MPDRVCYSLREIQNEYDHGDRKPLENLVRAFRGLQKKKPDYKLPLEDDLSHSWKTSRATNIYSKHEGYETVRYPLSGLVGTDEVRSETERHNMKFSSEESRTEKLNSNVLRLA